MNVHNKILIVEDDQKIRSGIRDNLEFEGFAVAESWNAYSAANMWRLERPDLVILDLMLPGKNGYALLKDMRTAGFSTPVIILSALGEEWNKIKGFRSGCDDYVVKPFSIIELIVRIKAILRRTLVIEDTHSILECGNVKLDLPNKEVTLDGKPADLKGLEFDLFLHFLRNPDRVIPRKEFLRQVWQSEESLNTRKLDVHIAAIRRIISDSSLSIETIYKGGYRLRGIH